MFKPIDMKKVIPEYLISATGGQKCVFRCESISCIFSNIPPTSIRPKQFQISTLSVSLDPHGVSVDHGMSYIF